MWYNLTMTKFFFLSKKKGKGIKVIIRLRKEVCLPFCFLFVRIKPSMAIHIHVSFFVDFEILSLDEIKFFLSFFDFSFLFCSLYLILVVWRIRIEKEKNKQAKKNPKNWSYNGVVLHRNLYCWLIWKKKLYIHGWQRPYIHTDCVFHEMDGWMDGNHNLSIFNAIFFPIYFVIVIYEFTKYIHRETERKNGSIIPYIVYIREYWCYFCSCFVVCSI